MSCFLFCIKVSYKQVMPPVALEVIFVLLVTAIGNNFISFCEASTCKCYFTRMPSYGLQSQQKGYSCDIRLVSVRELQKTARSFGISVV